MGNALGRQLRCSAPAAAIMAVIASLAAGCSLVEMPSNRVLAGPAQTAPASTPSASRTAAPPPPQLDVTKAEQQSANARTMSVSFTERVTGPTRVTLTGQVQVQRAPLRIAEQITVTASGQTAGQVSVIVTSRAIYAETSREPGYWIKLRLPQVDRTTLMQELRNADPAAQSSLLLTASHARFGGKQTVAGVVTSRYVASVAPEVALSMLPSAQSARLAPYFSLITGDIHYVLWIGPGDQLKQLRMTERALGSKIAVTATINSINQPVNIVIPQATQVPSSVGSVFASD
jgi:hypothetical protein